MGYSIIQYFVTFPPHVVSLCHFSKQLGTVVFSKVKQEFFFLKKHICWGLFSAAD